MFCCLKRPSEREPLLPPPLTYTVTVAMTGEVTSSSAAAPNKPRRHRFKSILGKAQRAAGTATAASAPAAAPSSTMLSSDESSGDDDDDDTSVHVVTGSTSVEPATTEEQQSPTGRNLAGRKSRKLPSLPSKASQPPPPPRSDIEPWNWTVPEVAAWLRLNSPTPAHLLLADACPVHNIDGPRLFELRTADLKKYGLSERHVKVIKASVEQLKKSWQKRLEP